METPDFLVIGAGVAGLSGAIELSQAGSVLVVAKDSLRESSSEYAQGGIAVALSDDDEVRLHEQDTIAAGAGLCDPDAVHTLVEEGPAAIEKLMEWDPELIRKRFPRVYETCLRQGGDISAPPPPVHSSAHYAMSGVQSDRDGRTSLPGLYAAGEVACTGEHGANLLTGLAFGARAGVAMREETASNRGACNAPTIEVPNATEAQVRSLARGSLRQCQIRRKLDGCLGGSGRTGCDSRRQSNSRDAQTTEHPHRGVAHRTLRAGTRRKPRRTFPRGFPHPRAEFEKYSLVSRGNEATYS